MSEYTEKKKRLEDSECPTCLGSGEVNDAEPGDISYSTWPCQDCGGRGSVTPSVNSDGVHASHCCLDHGCKYGDDNCPVVSGRVTQLYKCEDCTSEEHEFDGMDDKTFDRLYARVCAEHLRRTKKDS